MNLIHEYTDLKNIPHRVEHLTATNTKETREKIIEEVLQALTKQGRQISS